MIEEDPLYREHRIAALIPSYNEANHVGDVVRTMPDFVDHLVVVDDCSTDDTSAAALAPGDPRVVLIRNEPNQGLGGSLIIAHKKAQELGVDIAVVMAGDGQMDPQYLPALLDPIVHGEFDFTKGNRFFQSGSWEGMPGYRLFGNIVLTFMTKVATGYWDIFDPQNGYTAMSRTASLQIDWDDVARDYSFENDVIARLGLNRHRIKDVDIPAVYGQEVSDIKLSTVIPDLLRTLRKAFWRRIWMQYVVRSFSPVALFGLSGFLLLLWSIVFGIWTAIASIGPSVASTGTVMLAVLPALIGFQLLLSALVIDILNAPK